MSLLEALILVSEKAANVARICRRDEHLFQLLVQEKSQDANPRFVQDFKTLADVLIQETVKFDIGKQFPDLTGNIHGEENNTFSNKLGETVCIEIKPNVSDTAKLLSTVLNGDEKAAILLAEEVHRTICLEDVNTTIFPLGLDLTTSNLEIWIDPIDSTAEYISGQELQSTNSIYLSGLRCATVLLGVFDKKNGAPVLGIVNQPFCEQIDNGILIARWRGKCYWGVSLNNTVSSESSVLSNTNIICISSSEEETIKSKLKNKGFQLVEAAGAGYKALTVILGLADAYILSKSSTFKWDTCAPQAILKSLGGDIVNYEDAVNKGFVSINYKVGEGQVNESKGKTFCNNGGIIAFRNKNVLNEIISVLAT